MHAFPRSSVLVLENDFAVSSLIPSTLVDQVDALLDAHRIDDAAVLVDQRRRKLEENLTVDPDEAEELDYVYQAIGFKCFSETLFEDAGRNLFNGKLDPRMLVSYFPDLRGRLFEEGESEVDVFAGVADRMPDAKSIQELIALNLVLNYSPHLSPTSPPIQELTRVLNDAAREMLLVFSEKSRKRARVERRKEDLRGEVTRVVDTVLAKLYTQFSRRSALSKLLSPSDDEPSDIVLAELEPLLLQHKLFAPLSQLYKRHNEHEKLLDLYASLASATSPPTADAGISDPISGIFDLLTSGGPKRFDKATSTKWGLWMLNRGEMDRGMKLLIPPESSRRRPADKEKEQGNDLALLDQISSANETAGRRFLENLVLVKRYTSEELHTRLAIACIDDLLEYMKDEGVLRLWRAKASSYASPRPSQYPSSTSRPPATPASPSPLGLFSSSPQPESPPTSSTRLPSPPLLSSQPSSQQQSFLTYFSSTTPDSTSKQTRLKCIFMLSGSAAYDAAAVLSRLSDFSSSPSESATSSSSSTTIPHKGPVVENVLALEFAILYGKVGNHEKALEMLVHTLKDVKAAEMYCMLGGEVISYRTASAIASSSFTSTIMGRAGEGTTRGGRVGTGELGLKEWYYGLFEPLPQSQAPKRRSKATSVGVGVGEAEGQGLEAAMAVVRQKSVKEETKKALLTDLISVYTRDDNSEETIERTTRLVNSQGVNLDVVDVITLVPETWPLKSMHTFLARYFRRALHASHENVIVKNLSAGQNLLVQEESWPIIRDGGYYEEHDPDADEDGVGERTAHMQTEDLVEKVTTMPVVSEKDVFDHREERGVEDVVDIDVGVRLHERLQEQENEEEEVQGGVEGGEVMRGEERSALGLILDGGVSSEEEWTPSGVLRSEDENESEEGQERGEEGEKWEETGQRERGGDREESTKRGEFGEHAEAGERKEADEGAEAGEREESPVHENAEELVEEAKDTVTDGSPHGEEINDEEEEEEENFVYELQDSGDVENEETEEDSFVYGQEGGTSMIEGDEEEEGFEYSAGGRTSS